MKENVTQLKFDSDAEKIVYEYIENIISLENYTVEMHCAISEVLDCEQKELIDKYRRFCLLFFEDEDLQKVIFLIMICLKRILILLYLRKNFICQYFL